MEGKPMTGAGDEEIEVRIPADPTRRKELAEMAGLTDEERHALDLWCAEQAREDATRRRRGMEQHGEDAMP